MHRLVIEQEYEELFRKYMYPEFQKVFFEIKSHEEFSSSLTPLQKNAIEQSFLYIANAYPTFKYQRRIAYFYSPENLARISFVRMHEEESWYFIIDLAQEIGKVDRYIEEDTEVLRPR